MDELDFIEITPAEITENPSIPENRKAWYDQSYWREKGEPKEKVALKIGDAELNVVNFNKDIKFEDYQARVEKSIENFALRFPSALGKLKWILIRDFQPDPIHEGFPANGLTLNGTPEGTMVLEPRAFEDISHRIEKVQNLEGTITHELGHQIQDNLRGDWIKFWPRASDDPENWIFDKAGKNLPIHKITGQKSTPPEGRFLKDQESVVSEYSKINSHEDICESIVAYLYDPERLKAVSPEKFEIIQKRDHIINPITS